MNITTATQKAHALKPGQNTAAQDLYTDIEYELEHGVDNQDDYEEGENALAYLEEHFPDIRDRARQRVTDGKHTPRLSRKAAREVYGETETGTVATKEKVPEQARRRVATRRARYQARRQPAFPTTRQTLQVVDQATGSWGSTVWAGVLGAVGLSLLYLVLTKPTGVSRLSTGVTNALSWIINPTIDPLRPPTGAPKP